MTIKKRLIISNILMILVPVVITAIIGLICVIAIWYTISHGSGLDIEHSENFYVASQAITKMAEKSLGYATEIEQKEKLSKLCQLLDKNAFLLTIDAKGKIIYYYGSSSESDTNLLATVNKMNGQGFVSNGIRELYVHNAKINGILYRIQIYATPTKLSYDTLDIMIVITIILLLIGVILSILLTNRFLTKFIFQKIEQPLGILSNGVRQIRDGNLEYRIIYKPTDEFSPICSDFNEMAVRLKKSVDLTQQHEQSHKELLAGISHDLRSPLTSILAYVEGLIDGIPKTPEARRSYLETIKSKAEDIDSMVAKLFLFSKMDLGEYPDHPKRLQLDYEIKQLISSLKSEYSQKGLLISIENLVSATIYFDPEQFRRILINIIENSLKYKEKETGHLIISLQEENGGFRLSLCDDGPGVPKESLSRLFEAFYRSDPARQNPNRGSGLGLSIVANAIHRMSGTITAQLGENGGLDLVIWLPKAEELYEKNSNN